MHTFIPRRPAGRRLLAACVLAALAPEAMAYPTEEMSSIPIQTQVMPALNAMQTTLGEIITAETETGTAVVQSGDRITAARRSRIEWENRQREKRGLPRAGAEELISAAWAFVRERFREYQKSRREHGMKRHRARKDAPRTRKDIQQLVRLQIQKEIRNGRFFGGLDAVRAEIERRVTERMKLSRGHYVRLADDLLVTT
ncbi:hypothetical protein [Pantoea dispersa]|uniref:hypothetical protein n=1 Tax=Pantoea dispersa TaxID=59814 RepID=UPI003AEF686C